MYQLDVLLWEAYSHPAVFISFWFDTYGNDPFCFKIAEYNHFTV